MLFPVLFSNQLQNMIVKEHFANKISKINCHTEHSIKKKNIVILNVPLTSRPHYLSILTKSFILMWHFHSSSSLCRHFLLCELSSSNK